MSNKNKKYFISILLFCFVLLIMGVPYFNWGFNSGDDFGVIWHSKIGTIKGFFTLSSEGGAQYLSQPDNYKILENQSFFSVFYRPLSYIFYYLEYLAFGFSAYGFYLFTIAIHAFNTVLLFNLFTYFVGIYLSVLFALLFAFHASLATWIGWISAQPYQLVLLFFLLSLLALKKYLFSKKILYYIISCFLFLMILFLHEQLILFPFWLIIALFFYEKLTNENPKELFNVVTFFKNIKRYIKISSGYLSVAIFYLVVRNYFFPLSFGSSSPSLVGEFSIKSFIARRIELVFDYVTLVIDFLGGRFLSGMGYLVNGAFILFCVIILLWMFLKNRKKSYILFFIFSIFTFSWNVFLIHYQPRYIYVSLPFFILILLFGIRFYSGNYFKLRKIALVVLVFIVSFNVFYNTYWLSKRESARYKLKQSYDSFILEVSNVNELKNRPFCFVGIPSSFHHGIAQAMRIYSRNKNVRVYSEKCFSTNFKYSHLDDCFEFMPFGEDLNISLSNNKLTFKSLNCSTIWFGLNKKNIDIDYSMGKQIISKIIDTKICEFDFVFKDEFWNQNMIFVTWDYDKLAFKILS